MKTLRIRGGLLIIITLALGAVQPALAQKSTAFDAKDQFTLVSSGLPNILTATITKAKAKRLLLVTALVGTESSRSVRMGIEVNGVNIAQPTNLLTREEADRPGRALAERSSARIRERWPHRAGCNLLFRADSRLPQ